MLNKKPMVFRKTSTGGVKRVTKLDPMQTKAKPGTAKALVPARIQKVLAHAGLGSRRTIEDWIKAGKILVNNKPASLGQIISEKDDIKVQGKPVELSEQKQQPLRVLIYHKPEGEICSNFSEEGKPSVFGSIPKLASGKWVMIGRLDVNSSGLLMFTTDGDLANRMMHPRFQVQRQYAVRAIGELSEAKLQKMKTGVMFEEGLFQFSEIDMHEKEQGSNQWYTVSMNQGRYREVRRLFESQGATVNRLIRTKYGPIKLPRDLKKGEHKEMDPQQVQKLLREIG